MTRDFELWLLNTTNADIRMTACELFGFGQGKADEAGLGLAFLQCTKFQTKLMAESSGLYQLES